MPVFTFEKIAPPMRRVALSQAPVDQKPRSVVVRILDRFAEARVKRKITAEKAGQPRQRKPSK